LVDEEYKFMKTILCYGDSNTWGFLPNEEEPDPATTRYPWHIRWPGVLQSLMGEEYRVVENAINGRTTFFEAPVSGFRHGAAAIDYVMLANMPVDLITIMLGSNDVKEHFHASPYLIGKGLEAIIDKIRLGGYGPYGQSPEILIIAPASLPDSIVHTWLKREFDETSVEKSAKLAGIYEEIAQIKDCHFLNASDFVEVSDKDALHLDETAHAKLAAAVSQKIKNLLPL